MADDVQDEGDGAGEAGGGITDLTGVGKATEKAIDAADKYFGSSIKNAVGVFLGGDWLELKRAENKIRNDNLLAVFKKAAEKKAEQGDVEGLKKMKLKTAVNLVENASLEDDESLQELWAQMLANATYAQFPLDVTRVHVSLLKELEPLDVRILHLIFSEKMAPQNAAKPLSEVIFEQAKIVDYLKVPSPIVEVSVLNLMRVGCVKPGVKRSDGTGIGDQPFTFYEGTDSFFLSELGWQLCLSVNQVKAA